MSLISHRSDDSIMWSDQVNVSVSPRLHGSFTTALIRGAHGDRMLTDSQGVSMPNYYYHKRVYRFGEGNVRTQYALRATIVDCRWCLQLCNTATV